MSPINVWRYSEAPEEFRQLMPDGDDSDLLAVMPAAIAKSDIWKDWLKYAFHDPVKPTVKSHDLPDSRVIKLVCCG